MWRHWIWHTARLHFNVSHIWLHSLFTTEAPPWPNMQTVMCHYYYMFLFKCYFTYICSSSSSVLLLHPARNNIMMWKRWSNTSVFGLIYEIMSLQKPAFKTLESERAHHEFMSQRFMGQLQKATQAECVYLFSAFLHKGSWSLHKECTIQNKKRVIKR